MSFVVGSVASLVDQTSKLPKASRSYGTLKNLFVVVGPLPFMGGLILLRVVLRVVTPLVQFDHLGVRRYTTSSKLSK